MRRLQRSEKLGDRRMVSGVGVVMGVAYVRPWANDEGGPELVDPFPGPVEAVAITPRLRRRPIRAGVKELEEACAADRRCAGGFGLAVDEHWKRKVFLSDEVARMADIPGANDDEFRASLANLWVMAAQLRRMRTAVESAEMPGEDQNGGLGCPEITEAMELSLRIGKLHSLQGVDLHETHPANVTSGESRTRHERLGETGALDTLFRIFHSIGNREM